MTKKEFYNNLSTALDEMGRGVSMGRAIEILRMVFKVAMGRSPEWVQEVLTVKLATALAHGDPCVHCQQPGGKHRRDCLTEWNRLGPPPLISAAMETDESKRVRAEAMAEVMDRGAITLSRDGGWTSEALERLGAELAAVAAWEPGRTTMEVKFHRLPDGRVLVLRK